MTANDPGIGVSRVVFSAPGQPDWNGAKAVTNPNCNGYCTQNFTATTTVGNLRGTQTIRADIYDLAHTTPTTKTITVDADGTGPSIEVGGLLWDNRDGTVAGDVYELSVDASDDESGVRKLEFLVDGVVVDTVTQGCSQPGCGFSHTFTLDTGRYANGQRAFAVRATDGAGQVGQATFVTATVPAEGDLDPLADSDAPTEPSFGAPVPYDYFCPEATPTTDPCIASDADNDSVQEAVNQPPRLPRHAELQTSGCRSSRPAR